MGEPVHAGLVDLPFESRWPSRGRGQVIDDDGATRLEQFFRIGDPAAVQHQQVEGGRPVDLAPVAGQHRQLRQTGEQGHDEPGPFGIDLDADQPGAWPRAGRQPGEPDPAAGQRVDRMSERALARLRQDAVGFVFQAFHLMDELTAVENVELPALLAGRPARTARRRATELIERVGLAGGTSGGLGALAGLEG